MKQGGGESETGRGAKDRKRRKANTCKAKRTSEEGNINRELGMCKAPCTLDLCTELMSVHFHPVDEEMEAKAREVT